MKMPEMCKYDMNTEATGTCHGCGAGLCNSCGFVINGKHYCNECYDNMCKTPEQCDQPNMGNCHGCPWTPNYTIVMDIGKPDSQEANTLEEVEKILTDFYNNHVKDKDDYPYCDVHIYDEIKGVEITETQVMQEMFAKIIGDDEEREPQATVIAVRPDEIDIRRSMTPEEREAYDNGEMQRNFEEDATHICNVRKLAFGLDACDGCPISCSLSSNNYNELCNLTSANPGAFPDVEQTAQTESAQHEHETSENIAEKVHNAYKDYKELMASMVGDEAVTGAGEAYNIESFIGQMRAELRLKNITGAAEAHP